MGSSNLTFAQDDDPGVNTGDQTLTLAGQALSISGINGNSVSLPITGLTTASTQTGNFNASANYLYPVNATSANVTATLPTSTSNQQLAIKKTDTSTNLVNIVGTINGIASSTLPLRLQNQAKLLIADASGGWNVLAGDLNLTTLDARYAATGNYLTGLTGDLTATGPGNATSTLASVVSAGTVGSSSLIPVITYDAKGRITATSTAANSSTVSDATTTSKGIVQLAGDLGGTAASPTTPTAVHLAGAETITGAKTFSAIETLSTLGLQITDGNTFTIDKPGSYGRIQTFAGLPLTLNPAGNDVTIGATSPLVTNSLSVANKNIAMSGSNVITNTNNPLYLQTNTANDIIFRPNITEALRIKSSGLLNYPKNPVNGYFLGTNSTGDATWQPLGASTFNTRGTNVQQVYSVKDPSYGASANNKKVLDASMISGSSTLNSVTANFSSGDVGKLITVLGAGASGTSNQLITTISTYVSANQVTLAANATSTVSNTVVWFGNDDQPAINAAIVACGTAGGGIVYIPPGSYAQGSYIQIPYSNVTVLGSGMGATTIVAMYNGASDNSNGMFQFRSPNGVLPNNKSVMQDLSINHNTFGTIGGYWLCAQTSSATTSLDMTFQRVEFYNRGPDNTGSTGCIRITGAYGSGNLGHLRGLKIRYCIFRDGVSTNSSNTTGFSINILSDDLSDVWIEDNTFRNTFGTTINTISSGIATPRTRRAWVVQGNTFYNTIGNQTNNYFGQALFDFADSARTGWDSIKFLGNHFESIFGNWGTTNSNKDPAQYYNIANYQTDEWVVIGNTFKNGCNAWTPGFNTSYVGDPNSNHQGTVGFTFSNNIVMNYVSLADSDSILAGKFENNVFINILLGGFFGGYGYHGPSVYDGNLFVNCCQQTQPVPYSAALFTLEDGGNIIQNNTIYNDPIFSAPTPPTVSSNGTGVLTGAYIYKITFVSTLNRESSGGTSSSTITLSSQAAKLTSIPLGPSGTSGRNVYRTLAGGADGTQVLVANINNNKDTTFIDNNPDSGLGNSHPVPTTNATASAMSYIFAELNGGVSTDVPNTYKNNTIIGSGAQIATFALDSAFKHVIVNNTGLTETVIQNLLSAGTLVTSALAASDVVFGNYQLNGSAVTNPTVFGGKVSAPSIQVTTSPTAGYVLTSDATGNASWQAVPVSATGQSTLTPQTPKTANFTAVANSINNVSGTVTATLPTSTANQWVVIKKTDAIGTTVTVSYTLAGSSTTLPLTTLNQAKVFYADGSGGWIAISGDLGLDQLRLLFGQLSVANTWTAANTFNLSPQLPTPTAGDSSSNGANTQFVTSAIASAVTGTLNFKGSTDASANPNYPSATKGDVYVVSVAGRIGGASGAQVDVGDEYFATSTNAGGTQASVGTSWDILEHNLVGALLSSNNLSDIASASTSRTNLGLGTLATQNGTFSGTSSGTNTGDQTITLTGGVTGSGTGSFAATVVTNANLTGPITSVGNATSIASQTGTGSTFAMSASPTFTGTMTAAATSFSGAETVIIPVGGNVVGVTITQNDTTNNPNALNITNNGTGKTMQLTASNRNLYFGNQGTNTGINTDDNQFVGNHSDSLGVLTASQRNATSTGASFTVQQLGLGTGVAITNDNALSAGTGTALSVTQKGTTGTAQSVSRTGNSSSAVIGVSIATTNAGTGASYGLVVTSTGTLNGFATSTPTSTLQSGGSFALNRTAVADVAYTILGTDSIIEYTSLTAARTVTLPTAVGITGRIYTIKDGSGAANSFNITVATTSSQTIDGVSTLVISKNYGEAILYSDGANWKTINGAAEYITSGAGADLGVVLSNAGLRTAGTAYAITTSGTANLSGATNVSGNAAFTGSLRIATATNTTSTTLGTGDKQYQLCNSSTAITITLPTTTTGGYIYTIKNINTGTVTVAATIDGATNYTLATQYKYVTVISTTTSGLYYVVGNN